MSKSLGNFVTINELLATANFGGRIWTGEGLRLAMLRTHYRKPIDWTVAELELAESRFIEWADIEGDVLSKFGELSDGSTVWKPDGEFVGALMDDLNTPKAMTRLYALGELATSDITYASRFLASKRLVNIAGWQAKSSQTPEIDEEVGSLIDARLAARKAKNWAESDRIRDELLAMGIVLKDNKDGTTTWEVKR